MDELLTIERVAVLQRVDIFSSVPGHVLAGVANTLEEVRFDKGESVMVRGAVEDWLFVVARGGVNVHIGDRVLRVLGPGSVVGELAILSTAPRAASVTTFEPTLLLRLRKAPFEELLDDRPEIARAVIAALAQRVQELSDREAKSMG